MRLRFFAAAVILLAACSPDHQLARANKLEKKGKFYQAWQKYQEFAAEHPKHPRAPEALFHAGWLAQKELKDCSMAGIFYDSVIEKYPQSDPWSRMAVNQKANCPDYFPLLAGTEWVEGDSDSKGKNARIETVCKAAPDKGTFPSEAGLIVRTYFAGKEKFKSTQLIYKKMDGEIHEFVSEDSSASKVIFKIPPVVGTRWRTRDGQRLFTYEIIAVDKTVKVEAGEFPSCVLVKSTVDGVPGATNEYYAPSVGRILTAFATPGGEKRNIELMSFKPATDINFQLPQTNP